MNLKYKIIKNINYLLYFEEAKYNLFSDCIYGDMQDIIVFLEKILYTQGQSRFDIIASWVKETNFQSEPLIYDYTLDIGFDIGIVVALMIQYDYHNDSVIYFRPEDNSIIIIPHRFLYYDTLSGIDRIIPPNKPFIVSAGLFLEFLKWWYPYLKSLEAEGKDIDIPITGSFYYDETKTYPDPKFGNIILETAKAIIARETEKIENEGENWESLQQIKAWSQEIRKDDQRKKVLPSRITALETLRKSRPLLAREQVELQILQGILAAQTEAEIDTIISQIKATPTDAELRKILTAQAEARRSLIVDKNS